MSAVRKRHPVASSTIMRLVRDIKIDSPGECWVWVGHCTRAGYGFSRGSNRKYTTAHRVMYELFHEVELPTGIEVDHLCGNTRCVNPKHLEAVTKRENIRREYLRNPRKKPTHCPMGHEYTSETIVKSCPRLMCRVCKNDRARAKNAASARRTS